MFSYMQSAFLVGMFVTTLVAGNLANLQVGPIPGWRALWALSGVVVEVVALISVAMGILMVEPPRQLDDSDREKCCGTVVEEIFIMLQFLTIPTFSVMVVQGIFQELPWTVIGHSLLFFKLSGLEDWEGSVLASECPVVAVFGSILGGIIADFLAPHFGYHGRPLSAQISVALAIALIYLWFAGIPPGSQAAVFGVYFMVIACFGLVGNWAHPGTSLPILSDIVPSKNRSKVMPVEGALESSIATLVGPLFVANLAIAFGYDSSRVKRESKNIASATALGQAVAATVCTFWCVTFFGYIFLHTMYPSHMRKLNAQMKAEKAEAEAAEEAI